MKKFILHNRNDEKRTAERTVAYRELLNDTQYEAVMFQNGPALVIAGAGTGKTRTLTYRVARLIEDDVPPESILLLTFTRRAAHEMLDRAASVLDGRCQRVQGGTFHHYCNHLLHRFAGKLGFPANFTLLDQADAMDTIQHMRSSFVRQTGLRRFPQKQTLLSLFSASVNRQIPLYDVLAKDQPAFLEHYEAIETLQKRYAAYKKDNALMDFDDLLLHTLHLLQNEDQVRTRVAAENRFVMVDEYQDTNRLQADLVKLFSSCHDNLMAVGDDAQSIYAFRGADSRNILQFPEEFPGCTLITLEENYRSVQPVLDLANKLLEQAHQKFEKKLFTRKKEGDLPGLVKASTERDQSRFVAQMILHLREQDIPLSDIAVLFRNGRDSYNIEWELNKSNIPFRKFGGQKFAEAAHIRDVMAHIRVIVNPDDQVAWNRLLLLLDGIGPKTAGELVSWLKRNRKSELGDTHLVSKKYKKQLDRLSMMLAELKTLRNNPHKAVEKAVLYYRPICESRFDDSPKRIRDLEAFVILAAAFNSLDKMLNEMTLDPIDSSAMETESSMKEEAPLTLSTIHSAKGLEWDTVFVIQCLDGIIPSGFSVDSNRDLDEELRLLYVACTRAKERLFITYPISRQSSFGDYFSNPSRFISSLPETILEPWMLIEEKRLLSDTRSISPA